jgi:hypothetical protein
MNVEEVMKKLKEIQVEAFDSLHSAEEESELQVENKDKLHNCDPAGGEDTKKEPILGEKEKVPDSLSRTTPMAGPTKFNTPEKVYTSGEKKSITIESIQAQLDDLKKDMEADRPDEWGFSDDKEVQGLERLITLADSIWTQYNSPGNEEKKKHYANQLKHLEIEMGKKPVNKEHLQLAVELFPEGM